MLLRAFTSKSFVSTRFHFSWVDIERSDIAGSFLHMVNLCLTLRETADLFSKVTAPLRVSRRATSGGRGAGAGGGCGPISDYVLPLKAV